MKKVLITICLGAMFLTSCGGGRDIKADAKKKADLTCKMQKEPSKAAEITKELTELETETAKSYNTPEKAKEYAEACMEAMKNCK